MNWYILPCVNQYLNDSLYFLLKQGPNNAQTPTHRSSLGILFAAQKALGSLPSMYASTELSLASFFSFSTLGTKLGAQIDCRKTFLDVYSNYKFGWELTGWVGKVGTLVISLCTRLKRDSGGVGTLFKKTMFASMCNACPFFWKGGIEYIPRIIACKQPSPMQPTHYLVLDAKK